MSEKVLTEMGFEMKDNLTKPKEEGATSQTNNIVTSQEASPKENNGAETALETVANITLIVGISAAFVMLFTVCFITNPEYSSYSEDSEKTIFNPTGFAMTCGTILTSLAAWASMRVLANISRTLKAIKNKTYR